MYASFYKLSSKPFQLAPDPRFFFGSSGHKRAMSYLRYGLSQGEGFIVVTGGIGTGKTTLVRNLFAELDKEKVVAAQLVTTQVEADDMLRLVASAFGLAEEGLSKASVIKRFEDFLKACAREGKRVLLVVDEAQNLPPKSLEELRMLSNFQVWDTPLLQSFLLGQEEFRATLQSEGLEQLRQRIIASCHLAPLGAEETREYIQHRLRVVGWDGDPAISPEAFAAIHAATGGTPRRINILCDRLFLFGFLEELHEFSENTVRSVLKELEEETRSENEGRSAAGPAPAPGPVANPGSAADPDDLDNLVRSLDTGSASSDPQFRELLQRVDSLERTVETLRKGFVQLTRLLKKPVT